MTRSTPPPPTKFGPAGIQAKVAKASRPVPLPPPTWFGPTAAQRQTNPAAPQPGFGEKWPAQRTFGVAPPTVVWPVTSVQAKSIAGSDGATVQTSPSMVIQALSKKEKQKRYSQATVNFNAFKKYNSDFYNTLMNHMTDTEAIRLMVAWGFYTQACKPGHASAGKGSKKRGGTDEKSQAIRVAFQNYLGI